MARVVIPAESLDLILQTPEETLAFIDTLPPADRAEVSPEWIARVKQTEPGDPWALGYVVTERSTGAAVGGCAFKAPPGTARSVEIAYGIDPAHRGRGFATQAADALTRFALASGKVDVVYAHTRHDNVASHCVLLKCGFQQVADVMDPEDGLVMRWERKE